MEPNTEEEKKVVEAAPVEAAPVEAAPVEAAPVEAAPVEAAPVEAGIPTTATILSSGGGVIREYSQAVHGDDFHQYAKDMAAQNDGATVALT